MVPMVNPTKEGKDLLLLAISQFAINIAKVAVNNPEAMNSGSVCPDKMNHTPKNIATCMNKVSICIVCGRFYLAVRNASIEGYEVAA